MQRAARFLVVAILSSAAPVAAQAPSSSLPLSCVLCHHAQAGAAVPPLPTDAARLAQELRAFRDGTREGVAMPRLLQGLDDAALDALVRDLVVMQRAERSR